MSNIAEYIVETIKRAGVKRVWGLPGDSLNAFTDVLRQERDIEWMHVRHEEGAAFAAGAEAEITGDIAVVAGSCGPGNLHFINGLYDAQRNRVPVLAIAAHIPSSEIGSAYFQETKPQDLFRECSVYCEFVGDPSQMPWVLETAMRTAVERRGVAVIVVPGDVFFADEPERRPTAPIRATSSTVTPVAAELQAAADVLNDAKNVTILAGAGVAGAHAEVLALAERLQAPIVHALRGKEHIEYDNPYDVGMTGLLGFTSGYRAMEKCDALLMLGTDFPYRQFYPSKAKIVQVDLRGEQLGRRTPIDVGLVGDVTSTATALLPLLKDGRSDAHLADSVKHYKTARKDLDELADDDGKAPIHPQYVARLVDEIAADDAVFTADVGTPVVWAARYLHMNGRRRLLGSFVHGSMANALPQALGAQGVDRKRQVIALAGDGGLAMLMGELLTIKQNDLPVKIVVFNNSSLNFVELEMKAAGIVDFGTGLDNPNFSKVAEAVGLRGYRVEKGADLREALTKAFDEPGPALVEVVVAREELSMPPTITAAQMKGFALFALRTVLSGRGTELVDLADTNVWRRLFR
ncbi:ubiquinone-dependent pyruvate dehydrogenase [Pseudoclavibacter chungangensis]|uniref:Pyruvate dehydrogenase [ubiquinone] n=1 Tax=Pseudoclavibacter chungangensis TaxID=587635 RepID=A0A7J5C1D0_9MICO|nr:ubiquinone-dependent pyruvate dehydrogenase [Pseudoclavibacter chungangensis]KAB1662303.1 ubiquinone-dependent pyruvate dehydrogenase [Pseudoclavibacter chungangensis]NYJ65511.1 pyruvate dehydrogenase (quinone) [Pseudoclavibacter chungangensis]